ncbi:MAG: mechanosensitive ion channel [Gammaproteobacteria bacterium]|nr:MAG: mechanosensitive ion channel [Gammaproteobacteria bacterium]TND02127.1 MAG: mechanosensitive ion channel [Gammaproteobacteria bacterium]
MKATQQVPATGADSRINLMPVTRGRTMWFAAAVSLVVHLLMWASPVFAQTAAEHHRDIAQYERQLDDLQKAMDARPIGEDEITTRWRALIVVKSDVAAILAAAEQDIRDVDRGLEQLGEKVSHEPGDVSLRRSELVRQKNVDEQLRAQAALLMLRTDALLTGLTRLRTQALATQLLARGPHAGDLLRESVTEWRLWAGALTQFVTEHSGLEIVSGSGVLVLAFGIAVALAVGFRIRSRVIRWAGGFRADDKLANKFGTALTVTTGRYAPHLLSSLFVAVVFYLLYAKIRPVPFINIVAYGLPLYFLAVAVIELFLRPQAPARPFLSLADDVARPMAQRLQVLVLLGLVAYLFFSTLVEQAFPESVILAGRLVFTVLFVVNVVWVMWLLGRIPRVAMGSRWLRAGLFLVLAVTLVTELLGYRVLSDAVIRTVATILIAFGSATLAVRIFSDLADSLDDGRYRWQRRLKQSMNLKASDHITGLIWMRVVTTIVIWLGFAVIVLQAFGLSEPAMQQVRTYAVDGFTVGSLTVMPSRILLAIAAFALLIVVSGWLRIQFERKWLPRTGMERGAREAMVTIIGYVGGVLAIVVALSISGFTFTNLAIVAGALSVGIGFGLQNIVNNFVSGLILLFERPVKTGDWIVVGNTEGYVRRIRIRSTHIQTFDRADVIVPNSDLISNQVTNWMLYDTTGRLKVPVGVAYGSDTQKVKRILEEVAGAHPEIIKDNDECPLRVLFLQFGESSLNFELRAHIRNIDKRLQVVSDLHFAIDDAFRREGIEIPFPQRDIHVKHLPPGLAPDAGQDPGPVGTG